MMRTLTGMFRLLALFAVAAAGLSQLENQPYFALSSGSTFASNGKPVVSLSAWNVDVLEFRVYRIYDPLKFFQQIEDPHNFGSNTPQPPRERTLLEQIHRWKHDLRTRIRYSLRAQFTESPREHMESLFPTPPPQTKTAKETRYAEAPLLNSQQLVFSFVHSVQSKTRWERHTVAVPVHEKGVYLVEAVRKDLRAYTILIVSDTAMITKASSGRLLNIVVDRKTGQPLKNIAVTALTRDGEAGHASTNTDGIADMRIPATLKDIRLVANNGSDFAVNTVGDESGLADQWTGYIYTDRPVYRPGHTVHFKGVLRLHAATGYQIPAGKSVSVEIQDPDQKPVYQKTLTTSANGTIHDDLTLAPTAALGNYFIQVKAGEAFMSGGFEVEEYKKPEYEVHVTASKPRVIEGESVQATIDARYYFGEPVSGAKVKYAVYRERYWLPYFDDSDDDSARPDANSQGDGDSDDSGDQVSDQEAALDADGKVTIKVPTSVSDHKYDYLYRIEASVTDAANREITGTGYVTATYGNFVLNVTPKQYFYAPGSTGTFTIQARDYDNKPVRTRAHVELIKWDFREPDRSDVKGSTDVDIGADGSAMANLGIPAEGGTYVVRASARTPERRDIEASTYVWISGRWNEEGRSDTDVQIIPNKKSYRAGDTVNLLIVAGQPNTPVYVTVEGTEIRQYKLVRSQDSTISFDIPVTANDEPGISVSACFIRDGVFHGGGKYIKIPPVEHQLNVKVSTDKPQYLPGQTAEYSIDASSFDGKPAARAEFSLGVVDEAIYGIRRDSTQDILSFFFSSGYNRVFTDSSLDYFFTGDAGKRRMQLAQLRSPSHLAQLKPDRLVLPKVRKAFPDTAFWAADVVTDASGHARVKVEYPDSLTTWRATARGITPETKVGGATLKTIVRKNLILRLAVPRFFVQGDEVVISALIHNYLTDAKTARVSLEVQGLEVLDGATKDVQIASRSEAKVDWRVRATQVHNVTILGKALTNEESDALQLDIPVNIPGVKLSQARGGSIPANGPAGGSATFDLAFPAKVQPGSRSLSLRVSPSIAGSLFGALEYLTSFPYGCVEQTMSSFLPNIVVEGAVRDLGLKVDLDEAALQEKIRAGLDRLYSFQHEDGGWGWWETDDSHPFMTAYVVAGLAQAQAAGSKIKDGSIQNGVNWIRKDFAADPKLAADLRAYLMYALAVAGQPDAAAMGQVYDRRSSLSPYGMALLGLALEQVKDNRAGELAAALERSAQQDQEQAWWTADRDPMLDFSEDATPEATAYVAKFLSHQRKDNPLLPKAAQWLMNHRSEGYWWSSTKQTAMVIYGLSDYLRTTNELKPNLTVTVFVNDRPALTRKIDQATGLNLPEVVLDESSFSPASIMFA